MDEKNFVSEKKFVVCEKCKKILLERLPNGLWHFVFGRQNKFKQGNSKKQPPIDMFIHGSIKMKCWRGDCNHWNILNWLPYGEDFKEEV